MSMRAEGFRRIRESRNLTQKELADRIGCTRNYISMVENGVRMPTDEWVGRWKTSVYQ